MKHLFILLVLSFVTFIQALLFFDDKDEILELHNKLRKKHNSPSLKWSTKLAIQSDLYVNSCDFYKTISYKNTTDNVALGYDQWNHTILGWYKGGKYYDYHHPGYAKNAGAFITMIWKSTTHIGCSSTYCGGDIGRLYQCEYYPTIPKELVFDSKTYAKNIEK